jgi:hypothetical protein
MNSYNNFDGHKGLEESAQMGALGEIYGLLQGDDTPRQSGKGRWVMVLVGLAVIAPVVAAWVLL